jgi:hypothetical protein
MVNHYIRLLEELKNDNRENESDYDWIMLEMYDQTVRNISGGEMFQYFVRESIPNEEFVLERCGVEAVNLIKAGKLRYEEETNKDHSGENRISMLKYMKRKLSRSLDLISRKLCLASSIGRFRLGGEIHQWMYDTYSMGIMLKIAGFKEVVVRNASTSYLEDWTKYNLDTEPDGKIYKPDSSYIEGIKSPNKNI